MDPALPKQAAFPVSRVMEVFGAFLKLGLTSFGGPIAHLGYFHRELIERRRWVEDATYAQLLALAQLLPGPASSQLGFALGRARAGWAGAFAAFIAFTLPSAVLLFAFARLLPLFEHPVGRATLHGLKLVAVAVVAHSVLTLAQRLAFDLPRRLIAMVAASLVLVMSTPVTQFFVVALSAVLGLIFCRQASGSGPTPGTPAMAPPLPRETRTGFALIGVFGLLLVIAVDAGARGHSSLLAMAAAFYRSGALVFGGGHVVLPLLHQAVVVPGWVSPGDFIAGYGAAQALPGPLFSIAAFLGARIGDGGVTHAGIALIAIFLPGFLLMAGAQPLWAILSQHPRSFRALAGINAAVVGLLAAALYDPIWTSAVTSAADIAIVISALMLLLIARLSVLIAIAWCVLISVARVYLA